SFSEFFPHVSDATLLEVLRHELTPQHLYKLDATAAELSLERADDFVLGDNAGGIVFKKKATSIKDYPTITSVVAPLLVYFEILQYHALVSKDPVAQHELARASSQYCSYLMELNRVYTWSSVLNYHCHFFTRRRREMQRGIYTGWWNVDTGLKDRFVSGHIR
ncbi:hypothetical protein BJ165DRAFT_1311763, partial [Panaeolus papilionaceus]